MFLRSSLRTQPTEPQQMQGVSLPTLSSTRHVRRRYVVNNVVGPNSAYTFLHGEDFQITKLED